MHEHGAIMLVATLFSVVMKEGATPGSVTVSRKVGNLFLKASIIFQRGGQDAQKT
jgi:hypothetical protein